MYLLSFFVFMVVCVVLMAFMSGGGLNAMVAFIDMPSVILVVLLLVPMLLHAGVLKDLNNAFRIGGKRKVQAGKSELLRAAEAVSFTIKALWTVGIFSVVVGLVLSTVKAGVGVEVLFLYGAVALIPISYTTFFVILLLPLRARLNMQLTMLCEESVNVAAVNTASANAATVSTADVSTNGGMRMTEQEQEDCSGKRTE